MLLLAQNGAQMMYSAPPRGSIERQVEGTLGSLMPLPRASGSDQRSSLFFSLPSRAPSPPSFSLFSSPARFPFPLDLCSVPRRRCCGWGPPMPL
eukprot:3659432-Heterocapsa_arctica.AAC.1